MTTYTEVLFDEMKGEGGDLGIITLNRAAVLNSLNHSMVLAMTEQLQKWASATHIKAVVIRAAEGRAFCAGGDLRLAYDRIKAHDPAAADFFHDEYLLNRIIFHYPKPYIAILNGITMGGGVGISVHGSHRVATDRLLFAMPETGIGFFPDVGGTYFLPRLPHKIGFYLGLTGARIAADDCVAIGIATQKVAENALPDLLNELAKQAFKGDAKEAVSDILASFHLSPLPSRLTEEQNDIAHYFSAANIEDLINNLHQAEKALCKEAALMLTKKSPTSLKVTLHALQAGSKLDFDACMRQEFRLVSRFLQGHDFVEGIRAVIIDKDQTPHWQPANLASVNQTDVESYFEPLTEELV